MALRALRRLLVPALLVSCTPTRVPDETRASSAERAAASPTSGVVSVNGVRLGYVDWGGTGEPLVFVAGLGATAHAFDDFAPRFRDRFHVVAVTRRDAASPSAPGAFATDTLADDLAAILDALRLAPANVVAHSFGGAELTCLATRRPERVRRAVYLDAAYDHAKGMALYSTIPDIPPPPQPTADDARSADAYAAYLARVYGLRMPRSEAAASYVFEGGQVRPALAGPVFGALTREEHLCDYAAMRAPALAVYARLDTPGDMARFVADDPDVARRSRPLFDALAARQREDMSRFAREVPLHEILELHRAHHWVFSSNPDEVERAMRAFLAR